MTPTTTHTEINISLYAGFIKQNVSDQLKRSVKIKLLINFNDRYYCNHTLTCNVNSTSGLIITTR